MSAIQNSMNGMAAAQAQMAAAAQTIASTGLSPSGAGDLVDGVINAKTADVSMAVNAHMLRSALDMEKHMIDVLVH